MAKPSQGGVIVQSENTFSSIFMACVGYSRCEARIRSHNCRHSDLSLPEVEGASRCARTFGPRTHSRGREERSRGGQAPTSEESAISPHRLERPQGRSDQQTYL